jgi:hypothetical protein
MTAIDDLSRLHHMQDAAREALGFMSGKTRENLANDWMRLRRRDGVSILGVMWG